METEIEIWKPIEGYPNYEVSSFGNVRNIKTNSFLKSQNCNGYIFAYHNEQERE